MIKYLFVLQRTFVYFSEWRFCDGEEGHGSGEPAHLENRRQIASSEIPSF